MGKWAVAVVMLGSSACSHASSLERVRDLGGVETADAPQGWQGASLTIDSFEDLRPQEAWRVGVNRVRVEHPEHAHAFSDPKVVRVGDLEEEYPALLARSLPPGAAVSLGAAGASEFVVRGRLLQSTLSSHVRPILAVPGLVGIPVARHTIRFRVAVELYRGTSPEPFWSQTYAYDDKQLEGLYYGTDGSRTLAQAALRDSVQRAAADLTAVVAARRAEQSPVTES